VEKRRNHILFKVLSHIYLKKLRKAKENLSIANLMAEIYKFIIPHTGTSI
jgi:hypothetical protein